MFTFGNQMRFTAFILAILVLILSCIPCADMDGIPLVSSSTHLTAKSNLPSQQDNHKDGDLCSPFCHCACCAGFSIIYNPVAIPQRIQIALRPVYTEFVSADVIEISLPIWQPPQLV